MAEACWLSAVEFTAFRLLAAGTVYPPDEPFASDGGRFCDDQIPTLYVAELPQTAVAEYLRWNPELIGLQDVLALRVFRFTARILPDEFDLTTPGCGGDHGIPDQWPLPENPDPEIRYKETRSLARWVFGRNGGGIKFQSAAVRQPSVNHVLLADRWERTSDIEEVECPVIDGADVIWV